jgi:hypothetical protein
MKVIRITDEDTKLTKKQRQQIAILKLTDNGKYIEGVGIKDNEFFLLTEGDDDEEYLAYFDTGKPYKRSVFKDDLIKLVLYMAKQESIEKAKELLRGRKESNREVGESPSS